MQLPPPALAPYMARSASRKISSIRSYAVTFMTTPMLAPLPSNVPPASWGTVNVACIRVRMAFALAGVDAASSKMANSSNRTSVLDMINGGDRMNRIMTEYYPIFQLYQALRDQLIELLADTDLHYTPGGANPP